ncbi:hypothetical protein LSAT2_026417 [Lamellibrachia satsuma]|nr:hypothetical protein LSAT2_026417 [Lamellibrachia satsuma]
MSSLHALADSSSADVAPTLSPSSVAVAASDSRSAHAPSSFQSRSIRSRWYSPHQLDQSGRPSSGSLHKVGPFDMSDKHLGAWRREAQLIFFILARIFLLIASTHAHEGLVPCLVDVRDFEIVQQADTRRSQNKVNMWSSQGLSLPPPVREDVFIPEAVEGSPEEKREYNEFVHSVLIPALKSENISFIRASHDFPAVGNRSLLIKEAVAKCKFTIYCLCPVILTKFYQILLTPKEDKLIFLDIGRTPKGCVDWVVYKNATIIPFINDNDVHIGIERIRKTVDSKNHTDQAAFSSHAIPDHIQQYDDAASTTLARSPYV